MAVSPYSTEVHQPEADELGETEEHRGPKTFSTATKGSPEACA